MSWTPITREEADLSQRLTTLLAEDSLLGGTPYDQIEVMSNLALWIKTARKSGAVFAGYGPHWLPSISDISKSALYERIRSGKDPLPEPPPLGYSCPWYGVVEDPGPHSLFMGCSQDKDQHGGHRIIALQSGYIVEETLGDQDFIVKDGSHITSYRFRIWYDADFDHDGHVTALPGHMPAAGAWLIQNMAFVKK